MFGKSSTDGFPSLNDWLQPVAAGSYHPSIKMAMAEGAGGSGGYLVPSEYSRRWLDTSLETEIVRPRATIEPMNSVTKKVAGVDASDSSTGALFGGFSGQWLGEAADSTIQTPKFRKIELTARKLAIFTVASNELVSDGSDFEFAVGTRDGVGHLMAFGLQFSARHGQRSTAAC